MSHVVLFLFFLLYMTCVHETSKNLEETVRKQQVVKNCKVSAKELYFGKVGHENVVVKKYVNRYIKM